MSQIDLIMRQIPTARLIQRAQPTACRSILALVLLLAPLCLLNARQAAQAQTPSQAQTPAAIGTVAGHDVSVEHPAPVAVNSSSGTPVGDGSVVVVHSGKARMQLASGSTVSICGPAKFTVLQSGEAVTLALEFGSLHASLPNSAPLQMYTPFFTAYAESTTKEKREFTVGLDANGVFCARATQGGIRLEQQLTGHFLTVPEPSEIFLRGGDSTPLHDPPGHCDCEVTSAELTPAPAPPVETVTASENSRTPATNAPLAEAGTNAEPAANAESGANQRTAAKSSASAESPTSSPPATSSASASSETGSANVSMPVLAFDYSSRGATPNINSDSSTLLTEARVMPDWVFHGHVGATSAQRSSTAATGRKNAPSAKSSSAPKHESFWSKLKHFFGVGDSDDQDGGR